MPYNNSRYGEIRYGESGESFSQVTTPRERDEGPPRPLPEESLGAGVALIGCGIDTDRSPFTEPPQSLESERQSGYLYDFFAAPNGDLGHVTGYDEYAKDLEVNIHPVVEPLLGVLLTPEDKSDIRSQVTRRLSRDVRTESVNNVRVRGPGDQPTRVEASSEQSRRGRTAVTIDSDVTTADDEYHDDVLPLTITDSL